MEKDLPPAGSPKPTTAMLSQAHCGSPRAWSATILYDVHALEDGSEAKQLGLQPGTLT